MTMPQGPVEPDPSTRSEAQWRALLTPLQYTILREKGTEPPFRGEYLALRAEGSYACAGCGARLFEAACQYDSGSGWPSFWQPASGQALEEMTDTRHGMIRVEIQCARCGGHLGHVFDDGPRPTGRRYCVNAAALCFTPAQPVSGNQGPL